MTETPTPDEIARWAAEHHGWTPEDYPDSGEFCVECGEHMPCPTTRLLALVAAQAEQNAIGDTMIGELKARAERAEAKATPPVHRLALDVAEAERDLEEQRADGNARRWHTQRERAERAEAELSTLRATDDYQRWARAVAERDAARDAAAKLLDAILSAIRNEDDHSHFNGHHLAAECQGVAWGETVPAIRTVGVWAALAGALRRCGIPFPEAYRAQLDGDAP